MKRLPRLLLLLCAFWSFHVSANPALVAGGYHSCALQNKQVYCWGYGLLGQLGNNTHENQTEAVHVEGLNADIIDIAAGELHTCAATVSGSVLCWGLSYTGAVGNGVSRMDTGFGSYQIPSAALEPTLVQGLTGIKIIQLAAAKNSTCALAATGDVYCWGAGSEFQLGDQKSGLTNHTGVARKAVALPAPAKSLYRSENGFCAITRDERLYCWGYVTAASQKAYAVTELTPKQAKIQSLALGDSHSCFIGSDQQLYCLGDNWYQQTGSSKVLTTWTAVGTDVFSQIDSYKKTTCGVTPSGTVKCWGLCLYGLCGTRDKTMLPTPTQGQDIYKYTSDKPLEIPGLKNVRTVAVGARHACAQLTTGEIQCWGSGFLGQLAKDISESADPVKVNLVEIPRASCGASWWCAPQVTAARLTAARAALDQWSAVESQKPIYYGTDLVPLPLDGTIQAINKNNYNNIYGYGYYHWILRKAAKFVQLLFPDHCTTVLRVNSNYPYTNPDAQEDAHDHGLDADIGYILKKPNDPTSPIDFEAQFWFTYMIYSEAARVTSHRYSGFSYIHEAESYLYKAKELGLVESSFTFSKMLDPWEFAHVSHFHFGVEPCDGAPEQTAEGPRCH